MRASRTLRKDVLGLALLISQSALYCFLLVVHSNKMQICVVYNCVWGQVSHRQTYNNNHNNSAYSDQKRKQKND